MIDYQMRYTGSIGVVVLPSDIRASVEGWVSNSRLVSHAVPRFSRASR